MMLRAGAFWRGALRSLDKKLDEELLIARMSALRTVPLPEK
jgi:hypothetical protein